jgi:hypothetical protein
MSHGISAYMGPTSTSSLPHLSGHGFPNVLTLSRTEGREAEQTLRATLVEIMDKLASDGTIWSLSSIGPLAVLKNLVLLQLLARDEFAVTFHISESLKVTNEQAITTCEIVFTAPLQLVKEFLLEAGAEFAWDLKLCGWLITAPADPELVTRFKRDGQGRFGVPDHGVDLAFASTDDWDSIEFFSRQDDYLERVRKVFSKFAAAGKQ